MRFRQLLLAEERKLVSTAGSTDSATPTALGQYNARMLLSPRKGPTRGSDLHELRKQARTSNSSPPPSLESNDEGEENMPATHSNLLCVELPGQHAAVIDSASAFTDELSGSEEEFADVDKPPRCTTTQSTITIADLMSRNDRLQRQLIQEVEAMKQQMAAFSAAGAPLAEVTGGTVVPSTRGLPLFSGRRVMTWALVLSVFGAATKQASTIIRLLRKLVYLVFWPKRMPHMI
eukprot:SAG31_NODE_5265_length_2643_cov_1.481525_1_plen_233_part_00